MDYLNTIPFSVAIDHWRYTCIVFKMTKFPVDFAAFSERFSLRRLLLSIEGVVEGRGRHGVEMVQKFA
jgi:hypothetical protein